MWVIDDEQHERAAGNMHSVTVQGGVKLTLYDDDGTRYVM